PINDYSLLEKHRDFVELILSGVLPLAYRQNQMMQVGKPFSLIGFYQTPKLRKALDEESISVRINSDPGFARNILVIRSCVLVLNTFYGQNIHIERPFIFSLKSEESGLEQHFKGVVNNEFVEIKKLRPLKAISQETINLLISRPNDVDLWLQHVPPTHFEFHGLVRINLIDVTEVESLSRLRHRMLEKNAVMTDKNILKIQHHLRAIFDIPQLQLGLTAIDFPIRSNIMHRYKIKHSLLADKVDDLLGASFSGSIYEQACQRKKVLIIEDLQKSAQHTALEVFLLHKGIRSIMLVPLLDKYDDIIGMLEMGSPNPYDLNSFRALKLEEIQPLFRLAMKRSREEIDSAIENIIREKYTALHPSVEWKFVEKAFNYLEKREREGGKVSPEPIVFEDVYPLFGQADIVGSTRVRNTATQKDLAANLELIQGLFDQHYDKIKFPLLDQYRMRLTTELASFRKGISPNDEFRVTAFLNKDIHPFLRQLQKDHPELLDIIHHYFEKLDPQAGVVYKARRAYEFSVDMINELISDYLEEQEKVTQGMIPHYFEKYRTDGIQYDILVGQSLLQQGQFDYSHLRNLRLWQLITMCKLTQKLHRLCPELPVQMTTAQLILVQSTPLTIRFRMDEKQFDVDGALNIRYAIMKKRIDKAIIKGTDERLTKAGKVAIAYAQESDRGEYFDYIDFLRQKGLVTGEVEDLTLSDMQGIHGMKALRVKVCVEA
ncbi:MAG: GAF domain-containing protein, partial [Bacteroidota bacterium]